MQNGLDEFEVVNFIFEIPFIPKEINFFSHKDIFIQCILEYQFIHDKL